MPYPNRRGGGQPGADGRPVELQQGSGYIQWRYQGEIAWRNLIPLTDISGADGKPVNLRVNSGWIQWQHQDDTSWQNLMSTADMKGDPGPANSLSVGTVQQLPSGSAPQITITGNSPSQTINFSMPAPRDGVNGTNASMKVGTVSALPAGSQPTVQITGSAPEQTINFGIPLPFNGTDGNNAPNNVISIGTVVPLPAGSTPTASITGESPNQVLNLGLPIPMAGVNGANNTLSIGNVTSGPAAATITGNSPNQTLNLTLPPGANGTGITSQSVTYQASNSGATIPSGTWLTTMPAVAKGGYLWTRTVTTLSDNTSSTAYTSAYQGQDGLTGSNGNGVASQSVTYQASSSGTATPAGTWLTTIPSVAKGQYLWTRVTQTMNDASSLTYHSVSYQGLDGAAGSNGSNGTNGTNGNGIASQSITYQQSSSGITPPTGVWTSTIPSVSKGTYLWTRILLTFTDGSTSTAYAVAYQATDGLPGSNGTNGTNGTNGANYSPQAMASRTVAVATAYQHSDLTKPFKIMLNARSTQTVTVAGTVNDRVELRVGPSAASVAPGGSGGFSVGVWESGMVGISLMIGAAVQDGGQLTADVPAGWYFQINRLSGTNATIVSCFTQSMT